MIIGLLSFASESDIEILIAMIVCLFIAVMIWWEYYARPSRDSLKNIERALLAAPWMQSRNNQGMRRSA
jgi:hypothetical protein